MKKFRLLSLFLILSIVFTMFTGCGKKEQVGETKEKKETQKTEENASDELGEITYDKFPEGLTAKKIGSITQDSVGLSQAGIVYRGDNGKYGIMTFDGKKDTGAKYSDYENIGNYFKVMTVEKKSIADAKSLNCMGLIDVTGKELIPMKYAVVSEINERYIRVCEVTEQTDNKDEALVYYTTNMFSIESSDDDLHFKGKWYVYDVIEGKMLKGVEGTNKYQVSGYGNFIKYVNDKNQQIVVNHKGEVLPEGADLMQNGCYALEKENAGAVYDSEHNKLFDYELDGYIPNDSEGEYILASKYDNGLRKYVLMDLKGNVVSAEFDSKPTVYGDLIHAENKVYDFEGNNVIKGTVQSMYLEKYLGHTWFLRNEKDYTMITKDGSVLYEGTADETTTIDSYANFCIRKKIEDKYKMYSFADKDFTLEGTDLGPWLVKVASSNGLSEVVDSISGKTIIEGYQRYSAISVPGTAIYVYGEKADGGMDIFAVR